MKKISFLLPYLGLLLTSFEPDSLLNKSMPLLPAKTLDGVTVDEQYFKGKVTIVSFMYIGCPPCMNEISLLNKFIDDYAGKDLQVLCVAVQTRNQMLEFNTSDTGTYGALRKAMKIEPIRYAIQPACPDGPNNIQLSINGGDTIKKIGYQCPDITEKYGITAYPTVFLVDKKGIIRAIKKGGPGEKNDMWFYDMWKKEADTLLAAK